MPGKGLWLREAAWKKPTEKGESFKQYRAGGKHRPARNGNLDRAEILRS
jgi:hypothetical protein